MQCPVGRVFVPLKVLRLNKSSRVKKQKEDGDRKSSF